MNLQYVCDTLGVKIELPGNCPVCGRHDGVTVNLGYAGWRFCSEHKKRWLAGWNLDGSWRAQSDEQQNQIHEHYFEGKGFERVHEDDEPRLRQVMDRTKRDIEKATAKFESKVAEAVQHMLSALEWTKPDGVLTLGDLVREASTMVDKMWALAGELPTLICLLEREDGFTVRVGVGIPGGRPGMLAPVAELRKQFHRLGIARVVVAFECWISKLPSSSNVRPSDDPMRTEAVSIMGQDGYEYLAGTRDILTIDGKRQLEPLKMNHPKRIGSPETHHGTFGLLVPRRLVH